MVLIHLKIITNIFFLLVIKLNNNVCINWLSSNATGNSITLTLPRSYKTMGYCWKTTNQYSTSEGNLSHRVAFCSISKTQIKTFQANSYIFTYFTIGY